MLKVDNIHVAYGPIEVLKDVSLEVSKESIVSLIGANGAGKTTILNTISGLLTPTTGSIAFQDQNIAGLKPEQVIRHEVDTLRETDKLTPDLVFKDPYFLDFLNLNDRYLEKDLEDAILREMEHFILELGVGFSFVARQKRL